MSGDVRWPGVAGGRDAAVTATARPVSLEKQNSLARAFKE